MSASTAACAAFFEAPNPIHGRSPATHTARGWASSGASTVAHSSALSG
jgi:hypothetical protein